MFDSVIGIDLGTSNILVYSKNKGLVVNEPSVIAVDKKTKKIIAVGSEARNMIGRVPDNITVIKPLSQGVISDFTMTEALLKYYIHALKKKGFSKPRISICVPSGVTEVERRAVEDAAFGAGAKKVQIFEEPIAAAIGAGIDVSQSCGRMVVDIGGGTTDVAVVSLGGIVICTSLKVAGNDLDQAVISFIRKQYNVVIGEATAERIKKEVGCVWDRPEVLSINITGRDLVTGLPKSLIIKSTETTIMFKEIANRMVDTIYSILEQTPPELAADILVGGIILTGGTSLLYGVDQLIKHRLDIDCILVDKPLESVALGLISQ